MPPLSNFLHFHAVFGKNWPNRLEHFVSWIRLCVIWPNFTESCVKRKKIGPKEGRASKLLLSGSATDKSDYLPYTRICFLQRFESYWWVEYRWWGCTWCVWRCGLWLPLYSTFRWQRHFSWLISSSPIPFRSSNFPNWNFLKILHYFKFSQIWSWLIRSDSVNSCVRLLVSNIFKN